MAQKRPADTPGPRAKLEIEFDQPHLLGPLFGEFDRNLVAIEDRLGVYIAARGNRIQIEGEPEAAANGEGLVCCVERRVRALGYFRTAFGVVAVGVDVRG